VEEVFSFNVTNIYIEFKIEDITSEEFIKIKEKFFCKVKETILVHLVVKIFLIERGIYHNEYFNAK
jgi:hypothetical protein